MSIPKSNIWCNNSVSSSNFGIGVPIFNPEQGALSLRGCREKTKVKSFEISTYPTGGMPRPMPDGLEAEESCPCNLGGSGCPRPNGTSTGISWKLKPGSQLPTGRLITPWSL